MGKPNFFIAGAPKCATTALHTYLSSHPNIFMPSVKEPHYFAEDLFDYRFIKTLEQYLELFQEATEDHKAIGEASVWYLYSTEAIKNIYKFNENAKIIVMLRNPVDLAYSLHSELLYAFYEEEREFKRAWNLQSSRKKGLHIPKLCPVPAFLQYFSVCQLGNQVERLLNIFPPTQVKIVLYDDFTTSTKAVYEDVLRFLGVPLDGRLNFPRINESKSHQVSLIGKFTQCPPLPLLKIAIKFKETLGLEKIGIIDKIRQSNTRVRSRKLLNVDFRAELINEFQEDIQKLSWLVDKDLNHWMIK
ncbi:sulfotransferase [Coleofasciculus sp. FACHB-712]|uniref:sulfotransferase family protein n=1 Tax=Coleofasciculus sp. FACHB-712 TaxID=2692789 RepID=UPI0016889DAC|nr:sulfotransferase [Coleofasciculus sp. FACHB-712]MBD1945821.1 sulfotransferase [Coleofasciculus sp. FACHB-712]